MLALGQVAATVAVFGHGGSGLSGGASEPTITPADYAFTIWTIPIVSCVVYAAYALLQPEDEPHRSIGWPLATTMAGFSLWLWFAARGWIWVTVIVFVAMLISLSFAVRNAHQHPAPTRVGRSIVAVTLGVYAGWTTVAVWANLAAALHDDGAGLANAEIGWQLAVLAGAGVSAVIGVLLTHAELTYVTSTLWAFVAVVVATLQQNSPALAATAGLAAVLVVAAAVLRRRIRRPVSPI